MEQRIGSGKRSELVGRGLIRSLGGWSQVLSLRRLGGKVFSDERVLGSSEFVEKVIEDAEKKAQEYAGKSYKERHQENSLPNTRLNSVILMGLIR